MNNRTMVIRDTQSDFKLYILLQNLIIKRLLGTQNVIHKAWRAVQFYFIFFVISVFLLLSTCTQHDHNSHRTKHFVIQDVPL